jgi:trigger factor
MQVSVENTSELKRKMTVTIPEETVQEKMEARFKKLAKEIKLDGFRPGKVPVRVVKKQFADRVRGEVAGDLIQSSYYEALQQENLVPAGYPNIQPTEQKDGLEYVAEFEVYPEISLEAVKELQVTRLTSTVEDKHVDQMIEKLREQKKEWQEVERESKTGDRITIHFSGESEGENFTQGKVENYPVEIGAGQMIPGFEDELTGLKAGDSKTFEITFPEEYGNEKLAGKTAKFEIDVVKVEESVLPEIDEEFIKAYGIESGDLKEFREDVKANMERELASALKSKFKTAVMDALFEKIEVNLPAALIDQEIEELMKPYQENAKKQGLSVDDMDLPRDMFEEQAKRRVALGLILGEIIKQNDLKVDEAQVRSTVEEMASSYENPEMVVNWYFEDPKRLQEVQQMVLEDQTVDWVEQQATVTEESADFDDVMNKQQ